jgi:glycosyltransferase involved in cell wall biosynthesis
VKALAANEPTVEITGRVEDVRTYLAKAEVVVVPLRVGGGTRIKIPEAMAMAKCVVSTTIGAEGLPFQNGREIRIADEPEEFANVVCELFGDATRRNSLGHTAREKVVREHGWNAVVDKVEEVLRQVISTKTEALAA